MDQLLISAIKNGIYLIIKGKVSISSFPENGNLHYYFVVWSMMLIGLLSPLTSHLSPHDDYGKIIKQYIADDQAGRVSTN